MKDYPYIRKWGRMMGSYDYYIEAQIARANETNAPDRAVSERRGDNGPSGEWRTVDDLSEEVREELEKR